MSDCLSGSFTGNSMYYLASLATTDNNSRHMFIDGQSQMGESCKTGDWSKFAKIVSSSSRTQLNRASQCCMKALKLIKAFFSNQDIFLGWQHCSTMQWSFMTTLCHCSTMSQNKIVNKTPPLYIIASISTVVVSTTAWSGSCYHHHSHVPCDTEHAQWRSL